MSATTVPPLVPQDAWVFGNPRLHTDGEVLALAFAPDGTLWSVEEAGVARRWNPASGQPLAWHSLSDLETVWGFSGDLRLAAGGSDDLTLWDPSTGQLLDTLSSPSWVT